MQKRKARGLLEHADVQVLKVTRFGKEELIVDFRLEVGMNRDTPSSIYLKEGEVDELMLRTDPVEPSQFDKVDCEDPSAKVKEELAADIQQYLNIAGRVHFPEGEVLSFCRSLSLKPHIRYKPTGEGRDPEIATRSIGLFQKKVADKFGYEYNND